MARMHSFSGVRQCSADTESRVNGCGVLTCPEGGLCPGRRKKGAPWTGKNEQKKHLLLVARPPTSFFSSSCFPLSPKHHGPAAPIPPSLFLGDLPSSFHLPPGHRISSCLSRSDFAPPPSCIAIDIDIPRHFQVVCCLSDDSKQLPRQPASTAQQFNS
ncbi:hypothetical protein FCULG_00001810 [Fusarium culmorum]|uniref:Uncharacterized protein n=1 Tax=Fusarium culmorum TaxID=5516 RepID=A0A2T4GJB0_FUSCU|nr:hypothetical protein FCULG_00001810 [Fusarium culmorum]